MDISSVLTDYLNELTCADVEVTELRDGGFQIVFNGHNSYGTFLHQLVEKELWLCLLLQERTAQTSFHDDNRALKDHMRGLKHLFVFNSAMQNWVHRELKINYNGHSVAVSALPSRVRFSISLYVGEQVDSYRRLKQYYDRLVGSETKISDL